jgi:hypothetical protein
MLLQHTCFQWFAVNARSGTVMQNGVEKASKIKYVLFEKASGALKDTVEALIRL